LLDGVRCEDPTIFGSEARHNVELGLNVMLPLNVSLYIGLEVCTYGLGEYLYTWTYVESCDMEITRSLMTLGYETMVASGIQVEKGIEPLDPAE